VLWLHAISFYNLADVLNVSPSSFHLHVQLFSPTLGFRFMSSENYMTFAWIFHTLSGNESKVDVVNITNQTLSDPSGTFKVVHSNFLIQDFHD